MDKNKWKLNRAGLLNFWYYDEEEFYFSHGKLLLRGSNGSGKSVTMQSFIPVLLDGKKSPDRLDPFGSKARKMEDYLLGEKGVVERDERTGYLFLEYKREKTNEYLTTGIGLRAKRHKNMDFWGFVILDNRRIGEDFLLYKKEYSAEEGKEQKIPLSRRELEKALEKGGSVVRTQGEYMELVNKYVFGFENVENYQELIKLLIQLRSPKLSKEFKPTVIYEILNESLPPISDEELRPLSDTIESMDQIKQQLDQLQVEQKSLARLCKQYDLYNEVVLAEKAQGFINAHKKSINLIQKERRLQKNLQQQKEAEEDLIERIKTLQREQEVLKEEETDLQQHDVFKSQKEKQQKEEQLKEVKSQQLKKEENLERKTTEERNIKASIDSEEERQSKLEKIMYEILENLEEEGELAKFENHSLSLEEFHKEYKKTNFEFHLWRKESQDYLQQLEDSLTVLRQYSKIMEKYREEEKELGDINRDLDMKRREERKWEDFFEEEKRNFLENFHYWRKNNKRLLLEDEEVKIIAQRGTQIYDIYRLEEVREPILQAFHRNNKQLEKVLAGIQKEIEIKRQEMKDKKSELDAWKAKKDPEPLRHEQTIQARKKLEEKGIPHIPFFSAVEFKKDVSNQDRERIESAITRMGLLDALIVPEKHLGMEIYSDKIIRPNPLPLGFTLADFLYPTPVQGIDVSAQDIDNVLRSVLIEEVGRSITSIKEDGSYQIGVLKGRAPKERQSIYIGRQSRRQYRLQEIDRLEKELEDLRKQELGLSEKEREIKGHQEQLNDEYENFPADRDVHEAFDSLKNIRGQIQLFKKDIEQKNHKLKKLLDQRQEIQEKLNTLTKNIDLNISEKVFEEARTTMNYYKTNLQKLELHYKDFTNSMKNKISYEERYEDIKYEVDELKGEVNLLEDEVEKLKLSIQKIQERLQELGAKEIQDRIAKVVLRLREIPEQIIQSRENRVKIHSDIENIEEDISNIQAEERVTNEIYQIWKKIFLKDDELQFLGEVDSQCWSNEDAILKRAEEVWQHYGYHFSKGNLDREKVTNKLNKSFYQELAHLIEYRLIQEQNLEIELSTDILDREQLENLETYQMQIEQMIQKSRRILLLVEYNGQKVSPYYILKEIEKDLEIQEQLLGIKDRELYEEIIMNSVGRIIRGRIQRAQDWVKKMNQLMQERDTSSGLIFSLNWKPRTAEQEEEIDTEELVELLRLNPKLLKEEDLQKITEHFRSKIGRAKEMVEEKGYGETLHQMIKEILDYRQWFSFKLYYRKEGQQRRELTNNIFYTFSGGEKAMAMYIPLFSAAYSRYMEAREDAPYIISLDEAFAGVDENNIRDMFDLVEKLGFNYIINSQALWGDYDTVSSLSICELVRPKNAPFVTVVRYHWDGDKKHLLSKEEESHSFYEREEAVQYG